MMYNTRHLYIGQNKYCSTFEEIAVSLFRYRGDINSKSKKQPDDETSRLVYGDVIKNV